MKGNKCDVKALFRDCLTALEVWKHVYISSKMISSKRLVHILFSEGSEQEAVYGPWNPLAERNWAISVGILKRKMEPEKNGGLEDFRFAVEGIGLVRARSNLSISFLPFYNFFQTFRDWFPIQMNNKKRLFDEQTSTFLQTKWKSSKLTKKLQKMGYRYFSPCNALKHDGW